MDDRKVYEFTKYQPSPQSLDKADGYDIETIALMIDINNPGMNSFRDTEDYKQAEHIFIEVTMSCTPKEAISWMQYFMVKSVAYGLQEKDLDWRILFMAAYDLYNSLIERR